MKIKISLKVTLIICSVILVYSFMLCGLVDEDDSNYVNNKNGIVVYNDFEGGFYGIITTDNKHYDTHNLPVKFQQDSLAVNFDAMIIKDGLCPHMWGEIIFIIRIEIRE
jgi:hypothetical protein